jgi:membrane carboxypeptidase/penicillin-binding protein
VCGVWVGIDERRSLGGGVTGATGAVPIWVPAMQALERNLPVERFEPPPGVSIVTVCATSHKIATAACPVTTDDYIIDGTLTDTCDIHTGQGRHHRDDAHQRFGNKKKDASKSKGKKPLMF